MKNNIDEKINNEDDDNTDSEVLAEPSLVVKCKHCGETIERTNLIGLSLLCPLCKKPQNGHLLTPNEDTDISETIVCKHCGQTIEKAKLKGISLVCPLCLKPQNGEAHPV